MNSKLSTILSIVLAVIFHAVAAGLLLTTWESEKNIETTEIEKIYYIDSSVVTENPIKARVKREQLVEKKERERRRRIKVEKEQDRLALINRNRLEEEKVRLAAEQKARQEAEREAQVTQQNEQDETDRQNDRTAAAREQERRDMEDALASDIMQEQIGIRAVTDDEKAMAYVSQIQREIIQNWSRPPSARNGMQALLRVFLVPTGEVVNVTVMESSENEAFDRSAILAVRKAERFVVPRDARQFNRNFREFEVLFRPDDLRL